MISLLGELTRVQGKTTEGRKPILAGYMSKGQPVIKGFSNQVELDSHLRQQGVNCVDCVTLKRRSDKIIY